MCRRGGNQIREKKIEQNPPGIPTSNAHPLQAPQLIRSSDPASTLSHTLPTRPRLPPDTPVLPSLVDTPFTPGCTAIAPAARSASVRSVSRTSTSIPCLEAHVCNASRSATRRGASAVTNIPAARHGARWFRVVTPTAHRSPPGNMAWSWEISRDLQQDRRQFADLTFALKVEQLHRLPLIFSKAPSLLRLSRP